MNASLTEKITLEEVHTATFQMGKPKAPSPDGLNGLFYQSHWDIIHKDLFVSIQSFFQIGTMPTDLNRTILSLIPKVPDPERLDQFRSISLCNYAYKIISKILANRLKPFLPSLISSEQSAFVGGRHIQDNILIV